MLHLLEVRRSFLGECRPATARRLEPGMRFEADLRPFVRDGIEMADLYLRHGTHYYDVPFRCLHLWTGNRAIPMAMSLQRIDHFAACQRSRSCPNEIHR